MIVVDYLNNSVWARIAPSPIHGVGVFAIRDIPKYMIFSDDIKMYLTIDVKDLRKVKKPIRDLILDRMGFPQVETINFRSPNSDAILRAFMNHSTTPNTDGIKTLRKIKSGEELTEDYHTTTVSGEFLEDQRKHWDFV